jgi:uncharacterized protein DUF6529
VLSEGDLRAGPTALYDLFRIENGKIVEHWDVLMPIPPRDQWKNANGPFEAAKVVAVRTDVEPYKTQFFRLFFSNTLHMKAWLTTAALLLGLGQLLTAARIYGTQRCPNAPRGIWCVQLDYKNSPRHPLRRFLVGWFLDAG